MIFYFSGTGNTLDIARRIADATGDVALPLTDAKKDKIIGIAYPVYYGGLPLPVKRFLEEFDFSDVEYVYSVATYGGDIGGADAQFKSILKKRGIVLNAGFGFLLPDNFLPLFNPPEGEERKKILSEAYAKIDDVARIISARENTPILSKTSGKIYKLFAYGFYTNGRKTKKFFTTENCVKCGLCEKHCPDGIIKLSDGTVEWTKDRCSLCLGCINRCPKKAIQYGKATLKRSRYINPTLE